MLSRLRSSTRDPELPLGGIRLRGRGLTAMTTLCATVAVLLASVPLAGAATNSQGRFGQNESWTSNPFFGSKRTFFADVTGDRKADAIAVNGDKVTVRRSTGSKFSANESWTTNPYYGSEGTYFADVTGDGKTDAIASNDELWLGSRGITVRRSTGSQFAENEPYWTTEPYIGSEGTFFADVNGDGGADAIAVNEYSSALRGGDGGGVFVRQSTGYAFAPHGGRAMPPFVGSKGTFFADVTGDGTAEAIAVNSDKVSVVRHPWSRFRPNEAWTANPYFGSRGTRFADVTGDKKADAIAVNGDKITVRRSTGSTFSANQSWTTNPFFGSKGTFFADVTGDGKADAIAVNGDKITVRRSRN